MIDQKYKDVKAGKLSPEEFLQEARWDSRLSKYITNFDTFEDVVNTFKAKGFIFESEEVKPPSFSVTAWVNESLNDEINDCKTDVKTDHISAFEYDKGWRYELKAVGKWDDDSIHKAQTKAVKNIEKDALYYTKLEMEGTYPDGKNANAIDVSKGKNLVDPNNQMKPVKVRERTGDEQAKDYMKKSEDKEKNLKQKGEAVNEGVVKEYADEDEKEAYNDIEDIYGTPEVKAILGKMDYLGFDLPGEAMNAILTDKGWQKSFDIEGALQNGDVTQDEVRKVQDWRDKWSKRPVKESPLSDLITSHSNDKSPIKECECEGGLEGDLNTLPGGVGDETLPGDVDPHELAMGLKHEMEHTDDPEKAMEIALDHLTEDPHYYSNLQAAGINESMSGKSVGFVTQGADYKKSSVTGVVKKVKKSKKGDYSVTMKDGSEVVIPAKAKPGVLGAYVQKDQPVQKIVDLGKDLTSLVHKEAVNEITPEQQKYVVSPKLKQTEFRKKIEDAKKMIRAGASEQQIKSRFTQDIITAANSELSIEEMDEMFIINETIDKIVAKRLNEYTYIPKPAGPDVDRAELKRMLKGVDWPKVGKNDSNYADTGYIRNNNQQKIDGIKFIIDRLGQEGIDIYNEYAPEGCKWGEENDLFSMKEDSEEATPQIHQDIKDMEDLDPKDLAKKVLAGELPKDSVKVKAAALLLGHAIKEGEKDADVKKAFLMLSDKLKK